MFDIFNFLCKYQSITHLLTFKSFKLWTNSKLTKVVLNQQGKVLPKEQMMKILGEEVRIATAGTVLMPLMPLTVLNVKINAMVLEEYKTAIP